jgi:methionine-rich copper-binding protein CopC
VRQSNPTGILNQPIKIIFGGKKEMVSMKVQKQRRMRIAGWLMVAAFVLLAARLVEGHAILKESRPAVNSKVPGPNVPILLRYNVRIDAKLSKVQLQSPDNSVRDLTITSQSSPDTLNSEATGLVPGAYKIRWQVLAPDGHITRGEVPFTVTGS